MLHCAHDNDCVVAWTNFTCTNKCAFAGCIQQMEVLNIRQPNSSITPHIMESDNNLVTSRQTDENAIGISSSPSPQANGKQPFNIDFKWQLPSSPTRSVISEPFPFIAYLLFSSKHKFHYPHKFQITHDNTMLHLFASLFLPHQTHCHLFLHLSGSFIIQFHLSRIKLLSSSQYTVLIALNIFKIEF